MRKTLAAAQTVLLAILLLTLAVSANAQSNKGAIVGTVRDINEALVAKAKIKVTNVKTGELRETETNDEGTFTVTNLEPGNYTVSVDAPGFQTVTFQALQVETNSRLPLDVKFSQLSASTSSVTVTADAAPLVESETSVRGDLITGRQVTDLPLPQRNFTLLAALSPGVTRPNLGLLGGGGNFVAGGGGQNKRRASANQAARCSSSMARARRTIISRSMALTTTKDNSRRSRSTRSPTQSRSSRSKRACRPRNPDAPVVALFR